jgi:superfamily II DNA or RNA helicase
MDMGKTLRDRRQEEFANTWISTGRFGIIHACPRMGKCRIGILIMQKEGYKNILIAYPDNKIRDSWKKELEIMEMEDVNVTYTTYLSLHKHEKEEYDLVIADELHTLSENQIVALQRCMRANKAILGLSGTLSLATERLLYRALNMAVVAHYPIEKAIKEGILPDYEIRVVKVPLDDVILQTYGKYKSTEKKKFDGLTRVIATIEGQGKDPKFMRFARMRIIQNSLSKLRKTKELLNEFKDERILVFCGLTAIADRLNIPSHHSKSGDKTAFHSFVNIEGVKHLAVVKIGNTGVTYQKLNKVIINYFSSSSEDLCQKINRCMTLEYDNPGKKALIYITCSTEETEIKWLHRALAFFSKEKIKYL